MEKKPKADGGSTWWAATSLVQHGSNGEKKLAALLENRLTLTSVWPSDMHIFIQFHSWKQTAGDSSSKMRRNPADFDDLFIRKHPAAEAARNNDVM